MGGESETTMTGRRQMTEHAEYVTTTDLAELENAQLEMRKAMREMIDGVRLSALAVAAMCERLSEHR